MTDLEQFVLLCRDETELVSRLIVFLEQERDALVGGKVLSLESLADEKSRTLDLLSEKSAARTRWLSSLGIDGLESLRAWLADKAVACDAWMVLETALKKAMAINEFNGRQINQGLTNSAQALAVLRSAAASSMAYGPDGSQGDLPIGGRHLGSA
jgi:flagellar biosynthesis protein FlgN